MANKRLLLINWRDIHNPEAGGAEIYYHEIFKRLATSGFSVTVLCHHFAGAKKTEIIEGTQIIRLGSRSLFNWQIIPFILKNQFDYDLIIEDLNKIPFFTPLYVRQRRLHLAMHFFGAAIFRETIFPLAAYVYILERLIAVCYRKEPFVAISESTAGEVSGFLTKPGSVGIVEPGIDTTFFHPTTPKSPTPLLVYISRLKKYKNAQFLISAMPAILAKVPHAKLLIAGTGDYLPQLKTLVAALGLEAAVSFAGFVTEEQKRDLMSQATLFVNPSLKEGWGITNIEANLCGTISLSNNVAGLRDSVRDGKTGALYKKDDISDYINQTLLLLSNPDRLKQMEEAARSMAKTYDWDRIAERMATIIDQRIAQ